jgi:ferric-dicitrate binding protein FerR (iron transport regulator)
MFRNWSPYLLLLYSSCWDSFLQKSFFQHPPKEDTLLSFLLYSYNATMQDKDIDRLTELTVKYQAGNITPSEQAELDAWRFSSEENERLFEQRLSEPFLIDGLRILHEAGRRKEADKSRIVYAGKVKTLQHRWKIYTSVAAILFVMAAGTFLFLVRTSRTHQPIPITVRQVKDLVPGGNKAILTLDNDQQIVLDTAQNGSLAQQGGTNVQKLPGGQLAYISQNGKPGLATGFNTVSTPRGGQYQVLLPDGSKVWLNAASTLHFPTAFTGSERSVELVGEAYFEVAKNPLMPFKVKTPKQEVTVLGTQFNLNAYPDEAETRTTLVEGMVKVHAMAKNVVLTPGQQAQSGKALSVVSGVDTSAITAWRDGYFHFDRAGIEEVMRQLSRWYDVDVRYQGAIPKEKASGNISRDNLASDVLKILEVSGYHFKIDGRTIIVLP